MFGKMILFAAFLIFSVIAAAEKVPAPAARLSITFERNKMPWTVDGIQRLSKTLPVPEAENGWRIAISRPAEVIESGKNLRPRNTAEIILIRVSPESNPKKLRSMLTWKNAAGELYTVITYAGQAEGYHFFMKADILTIDQLKQIYQLNGGDDMDEIHAKALSVQDLNQFTSQAATVFLIRSGDKALPYLRRAISNALVENNSLLPHLLVLKGIGTPASIRELERAVRSDNLQVLEVLPAVMSTKPYCREAKQLYLNLFRKHQCLTAAIEAALQFGWQKDFLPLIYRLKQEPDSLAEFALLSYTQRQFRTGNALNPEHEAVQTIFLLLVRAGDTPGSLRMINISDKAAAKELEFQKEAEKRVAPYAKILLESKDTDCAISATLLLTVYSGTSGRITKEYIKRVNRIGNEILGRLPRRRVREVLQLLASGEQNDKEAAVYRRLLARFPGM